MTDILTTELEKLPIQMELQMRYVCFGDVVPMVQYGKCMTALKLQNTSLIKHLIISIIDRNNHIIKL